LLRTRLWANRAAALQRGDPVITEAEDGGP
jgi:hypothetical protein